MDNQPKKHTTYSEPGDLTDPYRKDRLEAFYIEKYENILKNEVELSSQTIDRKEK